MLFLNNAEVCSDMTVHVDCQSKGWKLACIVLLIQKTCCGLGFFPVFSFVQGLFFVSCGMNSQSFR